MIDLRRYTAIPGLIDVHTHIASYWDQTSKVHPFDQLGSTRLPAVAFSLGRKTHATLSKPGLQPFATLGRVTGTISPCATYQSRR